MHIIHGYVLDFKMDAFKKLNFHEVQDQLSSTNKNYQSMEEGSGGRCYRTEDLKESSGIVSHCFDYGFYQHQPESFLDYGFGELGEIQNGVQSNKIDQNQFSSASLKLLEIYGKGMKRLSSERMINPTTDAPAVEASNHEFSTVNIMKLAGERFVQSLTKTIDVVSILENPFDFSFPGLSDEEAKKVKLAELLLASAEKVGNQLYDRARILLDRCDEMSSCDGNSVERVVYYFAKALRERIDRETRKITSHELGKQPFFNIDEAIMAPTPNNLASHQEVPFSQVTKFAGIQTVIENVTEAKKIHVIDLGINIGVQWTGLMQALVSESGCPVELLKITAIGTRMKQLIEDTGKRLTSFAQSISLPFSFNIVMVSDLLDLRVDLFELDADETAVVYCEYILRSMISQPDRLDYLMKVIRILNPSIMVVTEAEYNTTSPSFVNRFIEALFYFSAYFDCLESCMGDNPNRIEIEGMHFGEGIRNILATEGEERKIRNAKLDVWRGFFAHFGMVETELSTSSLYLAKLIAGKFACGNACTIELDGKSLLIEWKGTPLTSLSAWKFI